jgi:hypothetical protein
MVAGNIEPEKNGRNGKYPDDFKPPAPTGCRSSMRFFRENVNQNQVSGNKKRPNPPESDPELVINRN